MQTGFTIIQRMGETEVQLYLPDSNQSQTFVTCARQDPLIAVLMGNLYYRYEILARLEVDHPGDIPAECATNPAELALFLYRALGASALERLEGDFSLVIWNSERKRFVGMRDPMGGYPLFWTNQADTLAFSTSIWALLDLTEQGSFNMDYFADFLARPTVRSEGTNESCAYAGVHRVLPGTLITVDVSPLKVITRKYWNWLAQSRDPGTNSIVELAEQHRELLQAAVRERLFGRTLAALSGGMDSTSVALIAQGEIHSRGENAPLHTLSLIYDRLPILAQERTYIEEVIQRAPDITAHLVPADDLLDFDSFSDPPPHEEPYAALWRVAMDKASVNVATQIGADTILTGLGADEIHDVLPFYLTDLLRQGRLRKAWKEAYKWSNASHGNLWGTLHPFGFANLAPPWLVKSLAHLQSWRALKLNQQTDWTVSPWILPDFARRHALLDSTIDHAYRWYRLCPNKTGRAMMINTIDVLAGDFLRWFVAAPRGIVYAHPFYDQRLLCFGIGMTERLQPQPGQMKPVLAESMRHLLPEKILKRPHKGHFNEVYYHGLARNFQRLEHLVHQAPLERLPIFDKGALLSFLREASFSDANVRQLQRLNSTLSLLLWLSYERQWRQQNRTPPSQIIRVGNVR